MSFPLYENIIKKVDSNELTIDEKTEFLKKFKKIDTEGHETTYALIKIFFIKNNVGNFNYQLPYNSKFLKSGIKFDLDNIPPKLQQILFSYFDMNIKKIEENHKLYHNK